MKRWICVIPAAALLFAFVIYLCFPKYQFIMAEKESMTAYKFSVYGNRMVVCIQGYKKPFFVKGNSINTKKWDSSFAVFPVKNISIDFIDSDVFKQLLEKIESVQLQKPAYAEERDAPANNIFWHSCFKSKRVFTCNELILNANLNGSFMVRDIVTDTMYEVSAPILDSRGNDFRAQNKKAGLRNASDTSFMDKLMARIWGI